MDKQTKITAVVTIIIVIVLFSWAKIKGAANGITPSGVLSTIGNALSGSGVSSYVPTTITQNIGTQSNNVPWWLTYNNDPSYYHIAGLLPLPSTSAGQANATCTSCSSFPYYDTVQL